MSQPPRFTAQSGSQPAATSFGYAPPPPESADGPENLLSSMGYWWLVSAALMVFVGSFLAIGDSPSAPRVWGNVFGVLTMVLTIIFGILFSGGLVWVGAIYEKRKVFAALTIAAAVTGMVLFIGLGCLAKVGWTGTAGRMISSLDTKNWVMMAVKSVGFWWMAVSLIGMLIGGIISVLEVGRAEATKRRAQYTAPTSGF